MQERLKLFEDEEKKEARSALIRAGVDAGRRGHQITVDSAKLADLFVRLLGETDRGLETPGSIFRVVNRAVGGREFPVGRKRVYITALGSMFKRFDRFIKDGPPKGELRHALSPVRAGPESEAGLRHELIFTPPPLPSPAWRGPDQPKLL